MNYSKYAMVADQRTTARRGRITILLRARDIKSMQSMGAGRGNDVGPVVFRRALC